MEQIKQICSMKANVSALFFAELFQSCWPLNLPGEEEKAAAAAALVQSVHSRVWQIFADRQELLELWCWGSSLVQLLNDGEKDDIHQLH